MQFPWDSEFTSGQWRGHVRRRETTQTQNNKNEKDTTKYCSTMEETSGQISSSEEGDVDELSRDFSRSVTCQEKSTKAKAAVGKEVKKVLWKDLNLHPVLQEKIKSLNFLTLNDVQTQLMPYFLEKDMDHAVIHAPPKSGKTISVLIGVMNSLLCKKDTATYPKAIMLYPTQALAEAAYLLAEQLSAFSGLKISCALRGTSNKKDTITDDIIIATPDKVLELAACGFKMKHIKFCVFDEADYFINRKTNLTIICDVFHKLPKCRLIVSTTLINKVLEEFLDHYLYTHKRIEVLYSEEEGAKEIYIGYKNINDRMDALIFLESLESPNGQTVVFCETKDVISILKEKLISTSLSFNILIGGKKGLKDAQQKSVLEQFSKKEIKLLITTRAFINVIPSKNITRLINFDPILTEDNYFNLEMYAKRKCLLNGHKNGLMINFLENSWVEHLSLQISKTPKKQLPKVYSVADVLKGVKF